VKALQPHTKFTVEYKAESKKDINKATTIAINTNTLKTTQYGEKNMLTGKISGELAPHAWYLNRLNNLATAHNKKLNIFSGYRSFELQQQLFNNSDKTGRMVAPAGRSRHQAGLAIDCDTKWVTELTNEELAKYGLHKPMSYENWHIEPIETMGKSTEQLIVCYGIPSGTQENKSIPEDKVNSFKALMELELKIEKEIINIKMLKN